MTSEHLFLTATHARTKVQGLALSAVLGLSACGGGSSPEPTTVEASADLATGTTTLQVGGGQPAAEVAALVAHPTFHVAPVELDAPADTDRNGASASAHQGPRLQAVPAGQASLSTRGLTLQALRAASRAHSLAAAGEEVAPAVSAFVATYSPAQVRAAYGLPALPVDFNALTATQAAQMGAGQTIYIVNAMHNPNVAAELAAFNQAFGLPGCSVTVLAPDQSMPLSAASGAACELAIAYTTPAGTLTSTAPAYEEGWATEIALDVQWAHATAPLARLVLIESPDASVGSLSAAVQRANAMGPGVVSMSFGAREGAWTSSVASTFGGTDMTYLAATGDWGTGVYWPAVATQVIAVGGTSLQYDGTVRRETGWSGTGGGVSAYTARPGYQGTAVPGLGTPVRRSVADVAFNADPSTGQYVAVMPPGSGTASWMSVGGTSLSTPQWAGLVAVANAQRALASRAPLGAAHAVLYGQVGAVPGVYAAAFADITAGRNGNCTNCTARVGYDTLTGLGSPNAGALLTVLDGSSSPPVVTPATINGQAGVALSFTASVTAPHAVRYALVGAPAGMSINADGVVSWAKPVAGTVKVTVKAIDTVSGFSGQGVYTVIVVVPKAPTVTSATVVGTPGESLSYQVSASAPNPVSFSLTGAPTGMTVDASGQVQWASPAAGTFAVKVTARDTLTGKTGQGNLTFKMAVPGPMISTPTLKGKAGQKLTGTIAISDPHASWAQVKIENAPLGMSFALSGWKVVATWPRPVTGNYSLRVTVTDSLGLSAQATVPVVITAR